MRGEQLALFPLPKPTAAMTTEQRNARVARARYQRNAGWGICAAKACSNYANRRLPFPGLCIVHYAAMMRGRPRDGR